MSRVRTSSWLSTQVMDRRRWALWVAALITAGTFTSWGPASATTATGGSVWAWGFNAVGQLGDGTLAMTATQAGHLGASVDPSDAALGNNLKYRVPMAPALDGNTVDSQLEQAAFAENSVRYQATLTFLNARLKELMTAITGS